MTAPMKRLTKEEGVIMHHFWERGPLFVREEKAREEKAREEKAREE